MTQLDKLREVLKESGPVKITLGDAGVFEQEDKDVVIIHVLSTDLHNLRRKVENAVENTQTFPDYKPHVTIAYVKKGKGKEYAEKLNTLKGKELTLDTLTFSDTDRNHVYFPLNKEAHQFSEVDHDLVHKAKQHFGETKNIREAGYLLHDGKMLDLTGRHQMSHEYKRNASNEHVLKKPGRDYMAGTRNTDHRELHGEDDSLVSKGGTEGMHEFMKKTGAIRLHPEAELGAHIHGEHHPKQIEHLVKHARAHGHDLHLDLDHNGNTHSNSFKRPNVEAVHKWIAEVKAGKHQSQHTEDDEFSPGHRVKTLPNKKTYEGRLGTVKDVPHKNSVRVTYDDGGSMSHHPSELIRVKKDEAFSESKKEEWDKKIAAIRADRVTRLEQAKQKVGEANGIHLVHNKEPQHQIIIHPSTKEKGRWQLSRLDEHGPVGHTTFDSKHEALASAIGAHPNNNHGSSSYEIHSSQHEEESDGGIPSNGSTFQLAETNHPGWWYHSENKQLHSVDDKHHDEWLQSKKNQKQLGARPESKDSSWSDNPKVWKVRKWQYAGRPTQLDILTPSKDDTSTDHHKRLQNLVEHLHTEGHLKNVSNVSIYKGNDSVKTTHQEILNSKHWNELKRQSQHAEEYEPDLKHLLNESGKAIGIGAEKSSILPNGIHKHVSPHGSTRYVLHKDGKAIAGLQVVSQGKNKSSVANVYTHPEHRRQGHATTLLQQAKKDFKEVVHSPVEHQSSSAKKWIASQHTEIVSSGIYKFPIHKNVSHSTAEQIRSNAPSQELRGLRTPQGDHYVWDAAKGVHAEVASHLGLDAEGWLKHNSQHLHAKDEAGLKKKWKQFATKDISQHVEEQFAEDDLLANFLSQSLANQIQSTQQEIISLKWKATEMRLPELAQVIQQELRKLDQHLNQGLIHVGYQGAIEGTAEVVEAYENLPTEQKVQKSTSNSVIPLPTIEGDTPTPPKPPKSPLEALGEEIPPEVRLPDLERSIMTLLRPTAMVGTDWKETAELVKAGAFAITGDIAQHQSTEVQLALAEAMSEGHSASEFIETVQEKIFEGRGPLSDSHLENIFRTNTLRQKSNAKERTLKTELVADAFPYRAYNATADARTRPHHKALEHLGIDNTNIYNADDPVFLKYRPVWWYSCRCNHYGVTVVQAANKGVKEAVEWVDRAKQTAEIEGGSFYQYLNDTKPLFFQMVPPVPFNDPSFNDAAPTTSQHSENNYSHRYFIDSKGQHNIHVHDSSGNKVASAQFVDKEDHIKVAPGSTVYVEPQHRRKGIATSIYNHIQNVTGKKIKKSTILTPDGSSFENHYFNK